MANESPAESDDRSDPPEGDSPKEDAVKADASSQGATSSDASSSDVPSEEKPKPKAARKPRAKTAKAEAKPTTEDAVESKVVEPGEPVVDDAPAVEKAEKKPDASARKKADDHTDDAKVGEPVVDEEDEDDLEPAKPPEKKRSRWRDLLGVVICVAVVLFARASLIDHYVVPTGSMEPTVGIDDRVIVFKAAYGLRIPNTQTWLIRWGGPQRGDVVVLESPPQPASTRESADPGGTILLKRVIGLPGDTVMVRDGKITVNGEEMQLDPPTNGDATHYVEDLTGKQHFVSLALGGGPNWGPTQLPDGKSPIPDCTKIGQDPKSETPTAAVPARMYLVMGDNRGNSKDGRIFGCVKEDAILGHAVKIYYSKGLSWKDL